MKYNSALGIKYLKEIFFPFFNMNLKNNCTFGC